MVKIKPESCKGCALCIERCPMDALQLGYFHKANAKYHKIAELDPYRCVGCGACARRCPTESLQLISRDVADFTPEDLREYLMRLDRERKKS